MWKKQRHRYTIKKIIMRRFTLIIAAVFAYLKTYFFFFNLFPNQNWNKVKIRSLQQNIFFLDFKYSFFIWILKSLYLLKIWTENIKPTGHCSSSTYEMFKCIYLDICCLFHKLNYYVYCWIILSSHVALLHKKVEYLPVIVPVPPVKCLKKYKNICL